MFRNFMYGRYGNDHLNLAIMFASIIFGIAAMCFDGIVDVVLSLTQFILLGLWVMRAFSRNIQKRRNENIAFLRFWSKLKNKLAFIPAFVSRIKDRNHKYFKCPSCRARLRVPKGRGYITITCPKCKTRFDKKS